MKKTNKSLDDLFAAARREEPIISEENARELLAGSEHMQPSPFIFSTKGIIMSTIGLSLAAFIGYLALSGSPQTPVSNKTSTSAPVTNLLAQAVTSTDEPKKSDDKIVKKLIIVKKSNDELPMPPTLPALITTPVKIAGIKPMALSSEKFAQMGITKKDDGTVSFSQKNKNGTIFTMCFAQNTWGVIIPNDKDQKEISNAPSFSPVIVTDTKGNKRLMQFSSNKGGMMMRGMQINSHSDDDEIDPAQLSDLISQAIAMQIGGKDGNVDLSKLELDSNQLNEIRNTIKIASFNKNGGDTAGSGKMKVQISINTNKNQLDTSSDANHRKIVINMDKTISIDSSMHIDGDAMKRAEKEVREVIAQLHLDHIDSLAMNVKKLQNNNEIETTDNGLEHIDDNFAAIEKQMNDLNNLVPILVRTATSEHVDKHEGITYDDGLIFWYEPNNDINTIVPEAQSAVSPAHGNTSVTESVLYPNPAKEKTTVHFTLAEPRTLAFSIHDLLGKRVLDGGSIAETSSGSFEHELNLSSLTAGVYLLVITTDKGEQTMQRLVIEK